jgi:hypothetical protein
MTEATVSTAFTASPTARNLLAAPLAAGELAAVLDRHGPLSPLPPLGHARWREAFAHSRLAPMRDELIRRALAEIDAPLPSLSDELYRDYAATGTRYRFERVYFDRRRRFARTAIAVLNQAEPAPVALATAFVAQLEDLMTETSWALPAHVPNPSGRDSRYLDLFASETANLMAECLSIFSQIIPEDLSRRIRDRLQVDVFDPFLHGDFFWQTHTNNWNAVCHQGILGAALAVETDSQRLAALLDRAQRDLPHFLAGFGEDGACSEGPGYWDYGFGWFSVLNEQLETRTRGELSLFANAPKVYRIAGYGPAMSLQGGGTVAFADCKPDTMLRPSTLRYLGLALDHPECLRQARINYARLAAEPIDYDDRRSDLFFWLRLFLYAPDDSEPAPEAAIDRDIHYPSLGLWVARGRDRAGHWWELAAKGGHNAEHHNHNDIGNFVLAVDGIALITEIGRPEYTRDYFSARRYETLAARTFGHSLPLINGQEQCEGEAFSGTVIPVETKSGQALVEIDATRAYPTEAKCRRFHRRLFLDKASGRCEWTDTIELDGPGVVESAVITDSDSVVLESPTVALIHKGGLILQLHATGALTWSRVELHPYSGDGGIPAQCRRLVLASPAGNVGAFVDIQVELKLRTRAAAAPSAR